MGCLFFDNNFLNRKLNQTRVYILMNIHLKDDIFQGYTACRRFKKVYIMENDVVHFHTISYTHRTEK